MQCESCGRSWPDVTVKAYYPMTNPRIRSHKIKWLCDDCLVGKKEARDMALGLEPVGGAA